MLDIKLFRDNPDVIKKDLKRRKDQEKIKWVDELISLDIENRQLQNLVQDLRHKRNTISREIAQLKKESKDKEAEIKLKEAATIPKEIEKAEQKQDMIKDKIKFYLMRFPNTLHDSVPTGETEEDNQVIEEVGKKPVFDIDPKSHVDILETYNIGDIPRAAKISGARFWFVTGSLAMLEIALQKYAIDFMFNKGYKLVQPPAMMNRKSYEGVTDLGDFEDVMYKIEDEDLYLIATSEHPLTAMFMDEILEEDTLPIKLAGFSPCFRKEAGSHGKDTKGIFRGHQFNKIEQIIICKPEESWKYHEELIKNAKEFFKSLGLHFRIINMCTADMGTVAAKKYDIECWFPAQNAFREVVSCSNCTDYQARRLGIRYRGKDGNIVPHTLNSTCVATSRALVAILETFQKPDGSIEIPKVLHPYMNGVTKIEKE
jgi:seryl-tRNA synthetase